MAYAYYAQIDVESNWVAGDETDFPVLINGTYDGTGGEPDLRTTANGGNVQNTASGGASGAVTIPADLVFSARTDGADPYAFEIESYDATTGQIIAWVRVPVLSSTTDTSFYVVYGDSSVSTSQEDVGGVWDSDYLLVAHLGEPSGTIYDSTSNGLSTHSEACTYGITGQVGDGIDPAFSGTGADFGTGLQITGSFTLEIWVDLTLAGGAWPGWHRIIGRWYPSGIGSPPNNYYIMTKLLATRLFRGGYFDDGGADTNVETTVSAPQEWVHLALVHDATADTLTIYVNGVQANQNASATATPRTESQFVAVSHSVKEFYWPVDEARISDAVRDGNYIETSYHTQNAPASFYAMGAEQEVPTDLELVRSSPQTSDLYLVIQQPQYQDGGVWTGYDWSCRINGAHSDDPMAVLTVDGGSAAVTLYDGQTVLVGSAYGEWDKGVFRIRGDQAVGPGTTSLDIGTSSEVRTNVADDDYVVVLDEFRLWQRYGRIEVSGEDVIWYKDYDITWEDLGAGGDADRRIAMMRPVPIMGPHAVKFMEIGDTTAQFYFDWSDSYATAPGQSITNWVSDGETDLIGSPGWSSVAEVPGWQTVNAVSGLRGFRVRLQVDDGYATTAIEHYSRGIRYVFTLRRPGETQDTDPPNAEPITDFELASPIAATFDQGYWRTSITVFEGEADKYNIMPEALVILFTEDRYTDDGAPYEASTGPIYDRENILLVGRIVSDSIRENAETGDVTFDVASPGAEAAMYHNYPIVIQNDDSATTWIDTPDLTVDRAVHYYTTWHTTLNMIADIYQTGNTIEVYAQDFLAGTMYATINQFLRDRLFARLLCDKYGRFFCEIDAQEQAFGTLTRQWTMQRGDWLDEVSVRQHLQDPVSAVDCGGLVYLAGTVTPYLSRAPGLYTKYRGARQESTALAITGQAALNTTCGRHLSALNYEFEADFQLAGNWRFVDIAPQRVVSLTSLVTERETLTGDYIIRGVTNNYLPAEGVIFTDIQTEQEADDGVDGVTIPIPDSMPYPDYDPSYYDGFGGFEPLGLLPFEPPAVLSGPQFYTTQFSDTEDYWTNDITADPPAWNTINHSSDKNKTTLMYSATTNRLFGYGYGIWEYSPLPLDTGSWSQTYTEVALATLFGHAADYNEVYVSRMQFHIDPAREGWAWATVRIWYTDAGTEHVLIGCISTRDAWGSIFYSTTLVDLEESVDFTSDLAVSYECGLAVDLHAQTIYFGVAKEPEDDGGGTPTFNSWWRLYRSTDCGASFHVAQSGGDYEWGTDGWSIQSTLAEVSMDIWVPWISESYSGGAVFWTVVLMMTVNDSLEQQYPPLVFRSLNHGGSYTNIGNDGGLDSGLNFLGGPYDAYNRVFGGISTFYGADTEVPQVYTWVDGGGWTSFNDRTGNNHNDFMGWIVTEQTAGSQLTSGLAYSEPYFVEVGAETDKVCTEDDVFWQTWVE